MNTLNITNKPIYAIMTVERFTKQEGTKNTWSIDRSKDVEVVNQTREMYDSAYKDIEFFRSLGGKEIVNGDTLTSISPSGNNKTIRTFTLTRY